jgi:hypothetical protein
MRAPHRGQVPRGAEDRAGQPAKGPLMAAVNQLQLFLPCAAGVEGCWPTRCAHHRPAGDDLLTRRGGVLVARTWRDALRSTCTAGWPSACWCSCSHAPYRDEQDLYARPAPWPGRSGSPPQAELQGRGHGAAQPAEEPELRRAEASRTRWRPLSAQKRRRAPRRRTRSGPMCASMLHLTTDTPRCTSTPRARPLFKRGWREDKGDAPLKETLAAAMLAASGWAARPRACRCTTPAAAAAPSPSRRRRSPAASRPARCAALPSRRCCRSRPMCGTRMKARGPARAPRRWPCPSLAATWRTAWSTSPAAQRRARRRGARRAAARRRRAAAHAAVRPRRA